MKSPEAVDVLIVCQAAPLKNFKALLAAESKAKSPGAGERGSAVGLMRIGPATSSNRLGNVVPIPTEPVFKIVMRVALLVSKFRLKLSLVPIEIAAPRVLPPSTINCEPKRVLTVEHAQPPAVHFIVSSKLQTNGTSVAPSIVSVATKRFAPGVANSLGVVIALLLIVAATSPVPAAVMSPFRAVMPTLSVIAEGSQREPFQRNTSLGEGAMFAISRPWSLATKGLG